MFDFPLFVGRLTESGSGDKVALFGFVFVEEEQLQGSSPSCYDLHPM